MVLLQWFKHKVRQIVLRLAVALIRGSQQERLRLATSITAEVTRRQEWPHGLYIRRGQVYADTGGVLLSVDGTNRYFKVQDRPANDGFGIAAMLESTGQVPSVIVDLGANFGEISIFLALRYPSARILAVEPSQENLSILYRNLDIQFHSTANISVAPVGVSDRNGPARITVGRNSENQITEGVGEIIECRTLTNLLEDFDITDVDFMKIDIEGSEPALRSDLGSLAHRIKALLVEFSDKGCVSGYRNLLHTLSQFYRIFSLDGEPLSLDQVEAALDALGKGGHPAFDLWFLPWGEGTPGLLE